MELSRWCFQHGLSKLFIAICAPERAYKNKFISKDRQLLIYQIIVDVHANGCSKGLIRVIAIMPHKRCLPMRLWHHPYRPL